MRWTSLWLLCVVALVPAVAAAQPVVPEDTVYGCSNVQNTLWLFDRTDPVNTARNYSFPYYVMDAALDPLTNRIYFRSGGAGGDPQRFVYCADATTLELLGPATEGGCEFETPGTDGSITIDPYLRVLYADGGTNEVDDCQDANPRHDSDGIVSAYSLVPGNFGQRIATIEDFDGAHWVTDGNHLTYDPTDQVLWSAPSEWTDGIRPRRIELGTVNARGGEFGDLEITDLPTIAPASSIGVDPDGRRIFLIPWDPPTHPHPKDPTAGVPEHPEAAYVRVYDMDSYQELETLDYRTPQAAFDTVSHCGYNVDFKLWYDRVTGILYETNFWEVRAMFYDLEAGSVEEIQGQQRDLYGFEASLPEDAFDTDHDDDGILDTIEVGANDLVDDALNDQDPTNHSDPFNPDSDGAGVEDGTEDANHNGRVDAGETNPSDPTDEPGQDFDRDGVVNDDDNCRAVSNGDQADADADGVGDVCDGSDPDLDGYIDDIDNCDCVFNPDQADADQDGAGDPCALDDRDGDTVVDTADNCLCIANTDQVDTDGNGVGDLCNIDTDLDTIVDQLDNCPAVANPVQENECTDDDVPVVQGDACAPDVDEDTVPDACDNCPDVPNLDQADNNNDGIGAACAEPIDTCACRTPGLPATSGSVHLWVLFAAGLALLCRRSR